MKCFFVHWFFYFFFPSRHLCTHGREGETTVTFRIAGLQADKEDSMHDPHFPALLFIHACMKPSYSSYRKCHRVDAGLMQVRKEATQALDLDSVFDGFWHLTNFEQPLVSIFWCADVCGWYLNPFLQLSLKDLGVVSGSLKLLFRQNVTSPGYQESDCHLPSGLGRIPAWLSSCKWLRTIKRSSTLERGWLFLFFLFPDTAFSCFLENFSWPCALLGHTSRCKNSSCIRNPTPAAICLLMSAMLW